MDDQSQVSAIAHVIQLSIAPVFLLAGVSGLLSVLTQRLARVIDRSRDIEDRLRIAATPGRPDDHVRLPIFSRRARLASAAITLCTTCASMVCLVILTLFVGAFFELDLSKLIGVLFMLAMISLFCALLCFLQEVLVATRNLRIGVKE